MLVTGKMALVHKVGQGHLLQHGDVNTDKAPHGQQGLDQFAPLCAQDTVFPLLCYAYTCKPESKHD
jgi:hypothetical protein